MWSSAREAGADAADGAGRPQRAGEAVGVAGEDDEAVLERDGGEVGRAAAPAELLGDRFAAGADGHGEGPGGWPAQSGREIGRVAGERRLEPQAPLVGRAQAAPEVVRGLGGPALQRRALDVGERAIPDDHPQEAEQDVAVAQRQHAATGHAERGVLREIDELAGALEPEPLQPGGDVGRGLAAEDRLHPHRIGLVRLGAVGEQPPAPVLDRDRPLDLGLEIVDDVLQVGQDGNPIRMVVIVGAGICGLAAAYELRTRGVEVLVLDSGEPGQSLGAGRIFRIAHRDPRLCELALEAREGWLAWEREFGVKLLGDEGLVVANGMWVGEPLGDVREKVPLLRDDCEATWDPLAGSLRCELALEALASRVEVRTARVTAVDDGGVWAAGERIEADAVIVCAGLGTQALIDPHGLDLQMTSEPHTRVTYEGTGACLISPDCYALPTSEGYAIGMHEQGAQPTMFVGLKPLSRVECVSLFAPWLDHGDGFITLRAGRVIALGASNAMKFAPLIGARLAAEFDR